MTLTITLPDELYSRLLAAAELNGTPGEFENIVIQGIESQCEELEAFYEVEK